MNAFPSIKPDKPSLVKWFIKHNVSSEVTSLKFAIRRAVKHEQNKKELELLNN